MVKSASTSDEQESPIATALAAPVKVEVMLQAAAGASQIGMGQIKDAL